MIIFNSDLDNTIIYSYKHDIGTHKRCVEMYQGREISFISEKTFDLLCEVKKKIEMIPTTTRTTEQYNRINLGAGTFKYALVCNGGVLLVDGKEDEGWYQDSVQLIRESKAHLSECMELLKNDADIIFEVQFIRELFVYTKSSKPEKTVALLKRKLNTDLVDVFHNGLKVYVMPKQLSKGKAVQRLADKLHAGAVIAAGDSMLDVSMLETADYAIAPFQLEINKVNHLYKIQSNIFAEKVLETVLAIEREIIN